MRIRLAAVFVLAAAFASSPAGVAFAKGDDPQPLPTRTTIRIAGSSKLPGHAPGLVAEPLGEAAKENITIEFIPMRAAEQLVALAAGKVDALATSPSAALFNALAQGLE